MIKIIMRGKDYLTGKMLQLLRNNTSFVGSTNVREEKIHINILANNYVMKEIETAWLEAERNKATAIMALQRQRLIY